MYVLSGQFDEFAQQGHPFAQTCSQANFSYHPELDLVEAAQEHVQIRCDLAKVVATERVVQ